MKKIIKPLAWLLLAVLACGIVTDAMCAFGLSRGWQYVYNLAALLAMPFLVFAGLGDKVCYR